MTSWNDYAGRTLVNCVLGHGERPKARFALQLWPDEDHEALAAELHSLVAPVLDRVLAGRGQRSSGDIWPNELPSRGFLLDRYVESEPGILRYRKDIITAMNNVCMVAGDLAGTLNRNGHWVIAINGIKYFRSRLIFKIHCGYDPQGDIDHINQDMQDDRIENLRDVTDSINLRNSRGRDGSSYVICRERIDHDGFWRSEVNFSFLFRAGEPAEEIAAELNLLITPEVNAFLANRVGRKRPPSRLAAWLIPKPLPPLPRRQLPE
jgi:hypothetical protein